MAAQVAEPGQATQPHGRLRNRVSIYVCDDGSVVFGDLPPALAEVAALVSGENLANPADLVLDYPVDPLCHTPDMRSAKPTDAVPCTDQTAVCMRQAAGPKD